MAVRTLLEVLVLVNAIKALEISIDGEALRLDWDDAWSCASKYQSLRDSVGQQELKGQGCSTTACSALIMLTALAPSCEQYAIDKLPEVQLSRYDLNGNVISRKGQKSLLTAAEDFPMYADLGAALLYESAHYEARQALPQDYLNLASRYGWHVLPGATLPTLFPESWIRRVAANLHQPKRLRFSFVGGLRTDRCTELMRNWVLHFARLHFSSRDSFLAFTDPPTRDLHTPIGDFDRTRNASASWWNPKLQNSVQTLADWMHSSQRSEWLSLLSDNSSWPSSVPAFATTVQSNYMRFDSNYFDTLANSALVLTPAGDAPWSRRFFEAIMSCAIPIVQLTEHAGRTEDELTLGYRYYIFNPDLPTHHYKYHQDWANENWRLFTRHNTLLRLHHNDKEVPNYLTATHEKNNKIDDQHRQHKLDDSLRTLTCPPLSI